MAAFVVGRSKVGSGDVVGGASGLSVTITDNVGLTDKIHRSPFVFTIADGASTTWEIPPNVTHVSFDMYSGLTSSVGGAAGAAAGRLTGTINLAAAGLSAGQFLHLYPGGSNSGASGGSPDGANGGGQGSGFGPGGGGAGSSSIRTSSAKADTLAMASGPGGASGGAAGPAGLTIDNESVTPNNASNGASAAVLNLGGGGGGGGWRAGAGGASNSGGSGGSMFAHSTKVSSPSSSTSSGPASQITLTWTAVAATDHTATITDTLGALDSIALARSVNATITDTLGLTDAIITVINRIIVLPDPVGIADTSNFAATYVRARDDPVGLTDSITAVLNFTDLKGDPVGITDAISWVSPAVQSFTDPLGTADLVVVDSGVERRNSFEGGTVGQEITAENSGGASGDPFEPMAATPSGGTRHYSNDVTILGGVVAKVATGATAGIVDLQWNVVNSTAIYTRAYYQFTANPSSILKVMRVMDGSTQRYAISVTTTGKIRIYNRFDTTVAELAVTIPLNAPFRLETGVDTQHGDIEVRYYAGANLHTNTPTESYATGITLGGTRFTHVTNGSPVASANVEAFYLDGLGISTTTWIGAEPRDIAVATNDNLGLVDGATVVHAGDQTRTDALGLTDTITQSGSTHIAVTLEFTRQVAVLV